MPPEDMIEDDAPLTRKGIEQAERTGEWLRGFFESNGIEFAQIIIKSSPYMRCIMTASYIATKLCSDQQAHIVQIDSLLSESLTEGKFVSDPTKRLALRQIKTKKDMIALKKKYAIPENVTIEIKGDHFAAHI